MVLTKEVTITWTKDNQNWYIKQGYKPRPYGEKFTIPVKDLSHKSRKVITVKCDYCGTVYHITYREYCKTNRDIIAKDACGNCGSLKVMESRMKTYGHVCPYRQRQERLKELDFS